MIKKCQVTLLALLSLLAITIPATADVRLHGLFTDNMVLQKGKSLPIWGTAEAGESVTISLGNQKLSTTANDKGKWVVRMQPVNAYGPITFSVTGRNTVTLSNVLVGEVWVCSGQSNMAWPVRYATNGQAEVAAGNFPEIRLFTVPRSKQPAPQTNISGEWSSAGPKTLGNFSAVAYFFGRELHRTLKVPIGLISASLGGTPAELWTPPEAFKSNPTLAASPAANDPTRGSVLYNGMIAPLQPYAIQGVIWYQGETNVARAEFYKEMFPALIRGWRSAWGQGDFPFLFVQLANYGTRQEQPGDAPWARLREAQLVSLAVPVTAMAVAIDVGEGENIHPKNKQEVGRRLALAALGLAYGHRIVYSGPLFSEVSFDNGAARIQFKHAEGLKTIDGGPVKGFAVAGEGRRWVWAAATIEKDTIVVRSPEVPKPVAVRYAWGRNPEVNLVNGAGLPASPFRTDDWRITRK